MSNFTPVPEWLHKRDGRLAPFDADKISRSLFAATESLGRPDAFLARELTDGVLHFLQTEVDVAIPTSAQLSELIIKVVRELGQPALARAFAAGAERKEVEGKPVAQASAAATGAARLLEQAAEWTRAGHRGQALVQQAGAALLREYSLHALFARDLVAAHRDGLLTLLDLDRPFELDSIVLPPPTGSPVATALELARALAGRAVILDGPEYALRAAAPNGGDAVVEFVSGLEIALCLAGLRAVVHLNAATAPAWANDLATGPLFQASSTSPSETYPRDVADALLATLARCDRVCIHWSLSDGDFQPQQAARLLRVAEVSLRSGKVSFLLQRDVKRTHLGEGFDRGTNAVLTRVALHLPALAKELSRRSGASPVAAPTYLEKLGSLVRLPLSAGVQKRDFLRRHAQNLPALTRGFFLDRARLVIVPTGLEEVVRRLTGQSYETSREALTLARQILQRIEQVARADGRGLLLDAVVEPLLLEAPQAPTREPIAPIETELLRGRFRAASALHAAVDRGAAVLPREAAATPEQCTAWLRFIWERTELSRVAIGGQPAEGLSAEQPRLFEDNGGP